MNEISPEKKRLGFTLTEIMIALVIIGVIAALALPSYRIQMLKIKNQEAIRVLMALWEAEKDYYRGNGVYTDNIADLAVEIPPMKNFTNLVLLTNFPEGGGCGGPIVTFRIRVDSMDSSYRIFILENGSFFCLSLHGGPCPDPLCIKMGFPAQYW